MIRYSIRDLEKISGVKAHTIRIWEKRYKVVSPNRTDTNIRYYSDSDLKRILNISILTNCGYRISAVAKFSDEELKAKVAEVTSNLNISDQSVESLVMAMLDLNEAQFEKTLNKAVMKYGFEETFRKTIYPFLQKVGILWQTGTITSVHEHFISALIKQKLIVAINNLDNPLESGAVTFVMFLPQNEHHEIGLLYYYYLIKKKGHKVIYLGASVPFKDILNLPSIIDTDFLFTSISTAVAGKEVRKHISKFSETFDSKTIFLTGQHTLEDEMAAFNNIKIITEENDFMVILENISHFKQTR